MPERCVWRHLRNSASRRASHSSRALAVPSRRATSPSRSASACGTQCARSEPNEDSAPPRSASARRAQRAILCAQHARSARHRE